MGCSALDRQLSLPPLLPAGTPSKNELHLPLCSPRGTASAWDGLGGLELWQAGLATPLEN